MLIIGDEQVRTLLDEDTCAAAVEAAMCSVSSGNTIQPLRDFFELPGQGGKCGWMPGYVSLTGEDGSQILGFKLLTIFPVPGTAARSTHYGIVALFDVNTGRPSAIVDAEAITTLRTPAASAVATRALARPRVDTLAILGAGEQAASHLSAMLRVRNFTRVNIWTKTPDSARAFVQTQSARHEVPIVICDTAEEAVRQADVVCTTTAAKDPVLKFEWLRPGAHVNAIGSGVPTTSELDVETVLQSNFIVEERKTIMAQGGEVRRALAAGVIDHRKEFPEIGEVLLGRAPGRRSEKEITVFKSVGLAAYDLAAANAVFQRAREAGVGTDVGF